MNLSTESGQVQRAAEGANEADGPFSAICYPNPITGSQERAVTRYFGAFSFTGTSK